MSNHMIIKLMFLITFPFTVEVKTTTQSQNSRFLYVDINNPFFLDMSM